MRNVPAILAAPQHVLFVVGLSFPPFSKAPAVFFFLSFSLWPSAQCGSLTAPHHAAHPTVFFLFFLALTGWMNGRDPLKTARETNGGGTAGAGALLSL